MTALSQVTRAAIAATHRSIGPYIRRTPVIALAAEDFGLAGPALTCKLEFLQVSGSFKARGAFANLLAREAPRAGVAAASGGNHGAAVAYAAQRLGVKARIFVPQISSPAKIARIRGYGAELTVAGAGYAEALAGCEAWCAATGALSVHAFDAVETMLGAGSVAAEIEEAAPAVDALLVAVGGGGLIAGIAAWYAGRVKVIGVEPELAPTLAVALAAGRPADAPAGGIAADSLAARRIGELVYPLLSGYLAGAVRVGEEAIVAAQRALWEAARIAAEPGAAVPLAALISGAYIPVEGERVGLVISGANAATPAGPDSHTG
jgi:threonine dehydratase